MQISVCCGINGGKLSIHYASATRHAVKVFHLARCAGLMLEVPMFSKFLHAAALLFPRQVRLNTIRSTHLCLLCGGPCCLFHAYR
jgi:hypothetical protein